MNNQITEAEIREKLSTNYGGDNEGREFIRNARRDNHGTIGSVVYTLAGSPPKGYAIVIPELRMVNLYNNRGQRFRKLENATVPEVETLIEANREKRRAGRGDATE